MTSQEEAVKEYEKGRKNICDPPAWINLCLEDITTDNKSENIQKLINHFKKMGLLEEKAVHFLLKKSKEIIDKEPNCVPLSGSWVVVGDLHGQFYDLVTIFDRFGFPPARKYLFLGDYVDRGGFGCEIVLFLSLLKLSFPSHLHLLRGNHETKKLSLHFNFQLESTTKYSLSSFADFCSWFNSLPLAATLPIKGGEGGREGGKVFFVHGGPPGTMDCVEELQKIDRFKEPEMEGVVSDCIWSDPLSGDTAEGLDEETMQEWYAVDFEPNPDRGCGMVYGYQGLNNFLKKNDFLFCVRAHEVKQKGYDEYRFCRSVEQQKLPLLVTLFSAPNYCDFYGNLGAVMLVKGEGGEEEEEGENETKEEEKEENEEKDEGTELPNIYKISTFSPSPHPFVLPKGKNAITYTLPHLFTHLTTLVSLLTTSSPIREEEEDEEEDEEDEQLKRRRRIREKILSYARMQQMLDVLRTSSADLAVIRENNEGILPRGLLSARSASLGIRKMAESFREAQLMDKENEACPGTTEKRVTSFKLQKFKFLVAEHEERKRLEAERNRREAMKKEKKEKEKEKKEKEKEKEKKEKEKEKEVEV